MFQSVKKYFKSLKNILKYSKIFQSVKIYLSAVAARGVRGVAAGGAELQRGDHGGAGGR